MNLSKLNKSQLEELRMDANFTEEEDLIYHLLSKGKSRVQIADKMNISVPTVDRRIKDIRSKLNM